MSTEIRRPTVAEVQAALDTISRVAGAGHIGMSDRKRSLAMIRSVAADVLSRLEVTG